MTQQVPAWQLSEHSKAMGALAARGADELAQAMHLKWGTHRLRLLVSEPLRAKFDSQAAKWHRALREGQLDDVQREAKRMAAAWLALDREATALGCTADPKIWEIHLKDGTLLRLVQSTEEIFRLPRTKGTVVWSLEEVAQLIDAQPSVVSQIKQHFGADLVKVPQHFETKEFNDSLDDVAALNIKSTVQHGPNDEPDF